MPRRFSACLVFVLLGLIAPAPSFAWQCRVGVAGGFAAGFAGLLSRCGIPHEFVLDHQLEEPQVLARYDALLLCSVYPSLLPEIAAPLQQYVRNGGTVLFGSTYPLAAFACEQKVAGEEPLLAWYCRQSPPARRSAGTAEPAQAKGPLAPEWTERAPSLVVQNRVSFAFPGGEVLAKYAEVSVPDAEKQKNLPEAAPGDPAMVRVPRGKGYYVVSGPALGVGMGLYGVYADALVLGLVRMMTGGRAIPQLSAEGLHLDRRQSAEGARAPATPAEEWQPVLPGAGDRDPVRPAAPGGQANLPEGFVAAFDQPEPEFAAFGAYLPKEGEGSLLLNCANAQHYYALRFTPGRITLVGVTGGKSRTYGETPVGEGTERVPFVVKERGNKLSVFLPGAARLQIQDEPLWEGAVGYQGKALTEWRFQPVAPLYFADDFMRTAGQQGEWKTISGEWALDAAEKPETSANPFTYRAKAGGEALAVAGYGFWDTYRSRAVVRPDQAGGAVGLVAYYLKPDTYWLFRARVNDTATSFRDGFELVRVVDGVSEVLAKTPGALVKNQWYELSVRLIDKWTGAYVDGQKVLTAEDTHFSGGKIGLWAQGAATFDDVKVASAYSQEEPPEVFRGSMPAYAGVIDQDTWAGPATEWRADPGQQGLFWNNGLFFGETGVRYHGDVLQQDRATVSLLLMPEQSVSADGYRLEAARSGDAIRFTLSGPGGAEAARVSVTDQPPSFSLRRAGGRVIAQINGEDRLNVPAKNGPPSPWRLGFRAERAKPRISSFTYWSDHTANDTFQAAPCKWWIGRGTWDQTSRWSCQPEWSWYGGVSPVNGANYEGPAVIWSKSRFSGDQCLEFYTGPKMMPKPQGNGTLGQMRDFNATLCGDGKDVRSGYAFLVGPAGADKAQLLRNGQVVAEAAFFVPREGHNRWLHLSAKRLGNEVSLDFDGQTLLAYHDPNPLPGGHAALWTEANGIIVPRVTLHYAAQEGEPLSLTLSSPPEDPDAGKDLGQAQTFADSMEGWSSFDDQATPVLDPTIFKATPGSLAYRYQPRAGAFPVLLSPALKTAGAKTVSFAVRCSVADEVVFTLMETDRSRYIHTVKLKPNEWQVVSLPLSRFELSPDSADENGQLDAAELVHFTVTDMDTVKVWQGRQKEAPERTVWLDDLKFS